MTGLDTLTAEQLDAMRRAMLVDTADDMKLVRSMMLTAYESNDLARNSEDVQSGVRRIRVAFDAMDAPGWANEVRDG